MSYLSAVIHALHKCLKFKVDCTLFGHEDS